MKINILSLKAWSFKWCLTVLILSLLAFMLPLGIVIVVWWINVQCDKEIKKIDADKI